MAISRYAESEIIAPALEDGKVQRDRLERQGLSTFTSYPESIFADIVIMYHTLHVGERLDQLARKYLGDGRYWWAICMVNGIVDPIHDKKLTPGTNLKIVSNAKSVVEIMRAYKAEG